MSVLNVKAAKQTPRNHGSQLELSHDMKPATHAPFFACLYAALCDTARSHGYALAIHGTVTTDCDLIAVPWTDTAADAETLMTALMEHIGAVDYRGLLQRQCGSWADDFWPENYTLHVLPVDDTAVIARYS